MWPDSLFYSCVEEISINQIELTFFLDYQTYVMMGGGETFSKLRFTISKKLLSLFDIVINIYFILSLRFIHINFAPCSDISQKHFSHSPVLNIGLE